MRDNDPNKNWVRINRCLMSNEIWLKEPFTDGQAWVDLILLANHKEGYIKVRGIRLQVSRGQVGMSEVKLAERWKWSRGKVRRFVQFLVQENMIEVVQQNNCVSTLISIVNYNFYQSDGTASDTANSTADGQQTVQQTDTNKKNKEGKEVKEVKPKTSCPDALRLSGLLAEKILDRAPNFRELNNGKKQGTIVRWAEDIDKLMRIDKFLPDEIEEMIVWCQEDEFWQSNILSGSTLRAKWDKLAAKKSAVQNRGTKKPAEFDPKHALYGVKY